MPKRPCPFEDDLPPQLKIHVGKKELDNGVCKEERMKDVYDKTLDLLKEGVKTLSRKLNSSMEMNPLDVPLIKSSPCKSKPERNASNSKQMMLNGRLELLLTGVAVKETRVKYDLCGCSRVIDQSTNYKCSYCDQILCAACLSECIQCSESFCQNCCLPIYDSGDHSMCLTCYR